jgi:hypothetical protein
MILVLIQVLLSIGLEPNKPFRSICLISPWHRVLYGMYRAIRRKRSFSVAPGPSRGYLEEKMPRNLQRDLT